jgi:predicted transcriptional regulator of viral defense system
MKKKIGTALEAKIVREVKVFAARRDKTFADVLQEALDGYLTGDEPYQDALRAADKFCSHRTSLSLEEIRSYVR